VSPRSAAARREASSADVFDDLDQLVQVITLTAGVLDKFSCSLDDGAALGRPGDGDATAASELEQSLVAEQPQRTEDGVGVDVEDGGEVLGRGEALAGLCLAVGDRPSDLAGDLFVQIGGIALVDLGSARRGSPSGPNGSRTSSASYTAALLIH
jgi:hypothetical protein